MKKTKTRQELAAEYGISRKTLARRIEATGLKFSLSRGVLLPADLINVYRTLGFPEKMSPEERSEWNEEFEQTDFTMMSQKGPKRPKTTQEYPR